MTGSVLSLLGSSLLAWLKINLGKLYIRSEMPNLICQLHPHDSTERLSVGRSLKASFFACRCRCTYVSSSQRTQGRYLYINSLQLSYFWLQIKLVIIRLHLLEAPCHFGGGASCHAVWGTVAQMKWINHCSRWRVRNTGNVCAKRHVHNDVPDRCAPAQSCEVSGGPLTEERRSVSPLPFFSQQPLSASAPTQSTHLSRFFLYFLLQCAVLASLSMVLSQGRQRRCSVRVLMFTHGGRGGCGLVGVICCRWLMCLYPTIKHVVCRSFAHPNNLSSC